MFGPSDFGLAPVFKSGGPKVKPKITDLRAMMCAIFFVKTELNPSAYELARLVTSTKESPKIYKIPILDWSLDSLTLVSKETRDVSEAINSLSL